jgi:hypothetical protein
VTTIDELTDRVEQLERLARGSGLNLAGFLPANLRTVRCDKDGNGEFEPYTSTSWDGNSFSNGATGTINWRTDFGLPEQPKIVWVEVWVRDSASTGGNYSFRLFGKSTTSNPWFTCRAPRGVDNETGQNGGLAPVAADGTTYYTVTASGSSTMQIWIKVVAYAK